MGVQFGYGGFAPTPEEGPIPYLPGIDDRGPATIGGLGGLGGAPVAPQQGGFRGFLNSGNGGAIMQALGASLLGSPRNAPLQGFGEYLPQFAKLADERREGQEAKAKESRTLEYLRQNFPEIASMVDSGLPISDAWTLAVKKQQGGDKQGLINAGDGMIYNPNDGTWITAPGKDAGATGQFRYEGNSVEAQSLNGLMDAGALTPEQAQQLGAGKTITGPNGEIIFMTPQGVFSRPGTGSEAAAADDAGNIQVTGPKAPDVAERNAMTFADRMSNSGTIIDTMESAGLSRVDTMASGVPLIGNSLVSENFQRLDQAKRDFINAQLRRESGAVISPEEFANANQQYFPQPGDTPQTLKQKADNRRIAIEGMKRDAGPTYGGGSTKKRLKFNPATGKLE